MFLCTRQACSRFSWLVVLPNRKTMLVLFNGRNTLAPHFALWCPQSGKNLLNVETYEVRTQRFQDGHKRQQHAAASIPHCQVGSRWHYDPRGTTPCPCCHLCRPVDRRQEGRRITAMQMYFAFGLCFKETTNEKNMDANNLAAQKHYTNTIVSRRTQTLSQ